MAEDDDDWMFKLIKNIGGYSFAAVIFTVVVLISYYVDHYWLVD